MKGEERRRHILELLRSNDGPFKGGTLSSQLKVTRQVIVQDIALLRAQGISIVATPQGYLLTGDIPNCVTRIIAVKHNASQIREELETIVALGGRVMDVTIEHKVYGELTGRLMIKSMYDIEQFVQHLSESSRPLSELTSGVHIHTIEADSEEIMDRIIERLKEKRFLLREEV